MRKASIISLLVLINLIVLSNWLYQQYKFISYDKEVLQVITTYVEDQKNATAAKNDQSNIRHSADLVAVEISKLRNDFNFNFITSFLATIILSIGIALYVNMTGLQAKLEGKVESLTKDVNDKDEKIDKGLQDKEIKIKKTDNRLKILDFDVAPHPVDLTYGIVRANLLVGLWDKDSKDALYIQQLQNALQRLIQILQNKAQVGHYEIFRICQQIPAHLPGHPGISRLREDIIKLTEGKIRR